MQTITKHYIDGTLVESRGSEVMDILKPTSGQVIARVTLADEEADSNTLALAVNMAATESSRLSNHERSLSNCSYRARKSKQGDQLMSKNVALSPSEAADRLAIRELIEAYAHRADRRGAKGQMSLFAPDPHFVVFMNGKDPAPSRELNSREALAPAFADLNKYHTTPHFAGPSALFTLASDRATGEAYCLAHQVTVDDGKRRLMFASLRYLDTFFKSHGAWLFSERLLYVDWLEERALS